MAVAFAAALLFATQARAERVYLQIDSNQSYLGFSEQAYDTGNPSLVIKLDNLSAYARGAYYGNDPSLPAITNQAPAYGNIQLDWTPGVSIQFDSNNTFIGYSNTYDYYPFMNSNGVLQNPPGGIPHPSQMGFEQYLSTDGGATFSEGYGVANLWNVEQTLGRASTGALDGGSSLPNVGGDNYTASDNALIATRGHENLFGTQNGDVTLDDSGTGGTGFPSPFPGANVTFDGTTLTIPVSYNLSFLDGTTQYNITTFGQIVAVAVPEPSTFVMLGFGAIGLVGCFIRARKRRG